MNHKTALQHHRNTLKGEMRLAFFCYYLLLHPCFVQPYCLCPSIFVFYPCFTSPSLFFFLHHDDLCRRPIPTGRLFIFIRRICTYAYNLVDANNTTSLEIHPFYVFGLLEVRRIKNVNQRVGIHFFRDYSSSKGEYKKKKKDGIVLLKFDPVTMYILYERIGTTVKSLNVKSIFLSGWYIQLKRK